MARLAAPQRIGKGLAARRFGSAGLFSHPAVWTAARATLCRVAFQSPSNSEKDRPSVGRDRMPMEATVSTTTEVIGQGEAIPTGTLPGAGPEGLDDLPVTVIERKPGWRFLDLGELWRYRELLFFLAWRDVTVRYKQTV